MAVLTTISFGIMLSFMTREEFKNFEATTLFCARCKRATPVRKRLLLILPEGEKYEYLCSLCGSSVGDKLEKGERKVNIVIP